MLAGKSCSVPSSGGTKTIFFVGESTNGKTALHDHRSTAAIAAHTEIHVHKYTPRPSTTMAAVLKVEQSGGMDEAISTGQAVIFKIRDDQ